MNDLDRHRVASRMNGFPIYDSHDDTEPSGRVFEPEWDWADLTPDQQATITAEAEQLQHGHSLSHDQAFSLMLAEYGIRCPHRWVYTEPVFRECQMCRVCSPLPGRVVEIDGHPVRVPDPPPPVWRVPVPVPPAATLSEPDPPTLAYRVREFHWTGRGYREVVK